MTATSPRPIRVTIIGGGCAAMAAAFELSRPEHRGRYQLTVYQQGWRLGGKGASGRGPSGRIEEHGLHIWMGFYENSFRLLRDCYAELAAGPTTHRFGHWRDAFVPDPYIGVAERDGRGAWTSWVSYFPPTEGAPGDPVDRRHPLSITGYLRRSVDLLAMLLRDVLVHRTPHRDAGDRGTGFQPPAVDPAPASLGQRIDRLLAYGRLATLTGIAEATDLLAQLVTRPGDAPPAPVLRLLDRLGAATRGAIEDLVARDDQVRRRWYVIDVMLAAMRGVISHRLAIDPRGFDAINDHDFCDWLRLHGATEATLRSGMIRGALYDLTFAYQGGDPARPSFAAGDALRSAVRMFFTYRGSFFWKMRAGMGDVVFAPLYEVLRRRGVDFRFFHRLDNVRLSDPADGQPPHVAGLDLSIQAEVAAGAGNYQPLIDVRGLPSWPSRPDRAQLVGGAELAADWDPESHWDQHRAARRTLRVGDDFDLVVLGVGLGAIPHVASELVARDPRWQAMVDKVGTVATQAFQVWLRSDLRELGWTGPSASMTGFVKPFDTWADMPQLIDLEDWRDPPASVAYFCNALETPARLPDDPGFPLAERERVHDAAVAFLDRHVGHFWPRAVDPRTGFRWQLLADASAGPDAIDDSAGPERFRSQFWTANVNPSDRYVQSLPGTSAYRISPLDGAIDNLTIAGDWTDCGLNVGCVEGAVMSGRLAAHALSLSPPLDDIVGYDHP